MGKHSKGIRYLGVSAKGRGERTHRKITKSKVTPLITKVTSRNNQSPDSITGFQRVILFLCSIACISLYVPLMLARELFDKNSLSIGRRMEHVECVFIIREACKTKVTLMRVA